MAAGLVFVKIVLLCTFATLTRTQSNRTVFSPSSSSGNSHESVLDRCFQKCASLLCVISVPALACQLIDKHMHLSLSCTCGIYRNRSFRQWSFRKRYLHVNLCFNKTDHNTVSVKRRLRTADCRLRTRGKMQTVCKMQTAD